MTIFLALVHFPVLNKHREVVATALTNVDVHDLARSGRTFGAQAVFVVTPVELQQRMVGEVVDHWTQGDGAAHLRRAEAMRRVEACASVQAAVDAIRQRTGRAPLVAVTGAQMRAPTHTFAELRAQMRQSDEPLLLVFGTGWGLHTSVIDAAEIRLPPITRDPALHDGAAYNHLSVRAAVAITLDRLCGDR